MIIRIPVLWLFLCRRAEINTTDPVNDKSQYKGVIRLTNVVTPTLTIYRPKANVDKHMGMIVCPGGGYGILAINLEGTEICEWLNSIGITAFLLKYRVPRREGIPFYQARRCTCSRKVDTVTA